MTANTVIGIDTIRVNAGNIPRTTKVVLGYSTGFGDVPWTQTEWNMFPDAIKLKITQLNSNNNDPDADIIDIEPEAATIDQAVIWCKQRIAAHKPATCYCSGSDVTPLVNALNAAGITSGVFLAVAHPGWSQAQAQSVLDMSGGPFPIVYIQYAWPELNLGGGTIVPGGNKTLNQTNLDLNLIRQDWLELIRPLNTPVSQNTEDEEMRIFDTPNDGIWFAGPAGYSHIPTPQIVSELQSAGVPRASISQEAHDWLKATQQPVTDTDSTTGLTLTGLSGTLTLSNVKVS